MDNGEWNVVRLNALDQKLLQVAGANIGRQFAHVGSRAEPVLRAAIVVRADTHYDAGETLCLRKIGGNRFAEAFAYTIEVDGLYRRFWRQLDIARISA